MTIDYDDHGDSGLEDQLHMADEERKREREEPVTHDYDELRRLAEAATSGPWKWHAEDVSLAILDGPQHELDHVLSVSPCNACTKRAVEVGGKDAPNTPWEWGRCMTPTKVNADFIAAANPTAIIALLDERERLREGIQRALADDETGAGGWGPDVTVAGWLREALEPTT